MRYTVSQLKDSVARKLVGRSVSRIGDFYDIAYESASALMAMADIKETRETAEITPGVFDDLTSYEPPIDYGAPIDVRPVSGRVPGSEYQEDYTMMSSREQDKRSDYNAPTISEKSHRGHTVLLLKQYPKSGTITTIDAMDSADDWIVSGNFTDIAEDPISYVEGDGSLRVSGASTTSVGSIVKSSINIDATNIIAHRYPIFLAVRFPTIPSTEDDDTLVELRIGTNLDTDYYQIEGRVHDNQESGDDPEEYFGETRYIIYRFDWSRANTIGSPSSTLFSEVQIDLQSSLGFDSVNFDHLVALQPFPVELDYYSKWMFIDAIGRERKERPTADEDIITASPEAFQLLSDMTAYMAMENIDGMEKKQLIIGKRLGFPTDPNMEGTIWQYKRKYPSERLVQRHITQDWSV